MVELYRTPRSPFWYFDMTVGGKRTRCSTKRTSKPDAEKVAQQRLKEALDLDQFGASREITLRQALFDHYLPSKVKAASYKHLVRYCEYLCGDREGVVGLGGTTKMHNLTVSDLRQYRSRRIASGLSEQSVDHEIKCVSAAYNMVKEDYRVRPGLRFPLARPKGRPRYLTDEEEAALLADLDPERPIVMRGKATGFSDPLARPSRQRQDNHDLAVMLLDTGARYGEIARLTWAMVDTQDFSWVHIFRAKVQNEGRLSTTARMQEVLKRRYEGRGNSAYVFPGWHRETNGEDLPRVTTAAIRRAMERVGINSPQNVARFGRRDVRSLRDTFATKLRIKARMPLDRLQKLLGHASPQMTQKYADLAVDTASLEAASFLNQLHSAATGRY